MKIYLAGNPMTHLERLIALRQRLLAAGHTITFDWLAEFEKPRIEHEDNKTWDWSRRQSANQDLLGVEDCDVFVLLDAPLGWGMYTEFGYALGRRKPVIVIDPQYLQVFFHHKRVVITGDETQALDRLADLAFVIG